MDYRIFLVDPMDREGGGAEVVVDYNDLKTFFDSRVVRLPGWHYEISIRDEQTQNFTVLARDLKTRTEVQAAFLKL